MEGRLHGRDSGDQSLTGVGKIFKTARRILYDAMASEGRE